MNKIFYPLLIQLILLGAFQAQAASQYFGPGIGTTFVIPEGVQQITIQATSGGGGGGGSCFGAGGFGGPDNYDTSSFNVTAGTTLTVQTQWGGTGGCGGGGGGAGGSVWVTGPSVNFVSYGGPGGNGSGGGCIGGCGGKGGDSSATISW